jgi:hypothetical protein
LADVIKAEEHVLVKLKDLVLRFGGRERSCSGEDSIVLGSHEFRIEVDQLLRGMFV